MDRLAQERRHLTEADRHIAAGERRIASQARLVRRLQAASRRADVAEALLANLRDTLKAWTLHRNTILREITRLKAAPR